MDLILFLFYCLLACFFYFPFFQSPKSIIKVGILSLGLVLPLFFLVTMGTIGAFGAAVIAKMSWLTVEFFHIIDLPFLLLEQAGLIFLITWYTFILMAVSQTIFVLSDTLGKNSVPH